MRITGTHFRVKIMQFVQSGLNHCCVCFRRIGRINSRTMTALPRLPGLVGAIRVCVVVSKLINECLEVFMSCSYRKVLRAAAPDSKANESGKEEDQTPGRSIRVP